MRVPKRLFVSLALIAAVGCRGDAAGDRSRPIAKSMVAPSPSAPPKPRVVDADGLKRLVAQYRGKLILLDFWATWCVPCVKALPELARLQERFGPRGLQVIAVSFDEPENWDDRALPRLKQAGWNGPAVVARDVAARNAIVDWLGDNWRSELPARYLIGRDGTILRELLATSDAPVVPMEEIIEEHLGGG